MVAPLLGPLPADRGDVATIMKYCIQEEFVTDRFCFHLQVLAVDLLNPNPQTEARKHKLKVRSTR